MPLAKFKHVVSCSSHDPAFPPENLLNVESYKKWNCVSGEKQATVVLQLEKAIQVQNFDIGNDRSAFIEVLAGNSSDSTDNYEVILIASSFMSPLDSRNLTNINRVRMFGVDLLEKAVVPKKFDRFKIVCTQPFNKNVSYGIAFIRITCVDDPSNDTADIPKPEKQLSLGKFTVKPEEKDTIAPGSLFMKRQTHEKEPVLSADALTNIKKAEVTAINPSPPAPQRAVSKLKPSKRSSNGDAAAISEPDIKKGRSKSPEAKTKQPTSSSSDTATQKKVKIKIVKSVSFNKLFNAVTFTLSGFQNPLRGQLRQKAIDMGAIYKPDWRKECTHLICAFANTPKYQQVKKGKGKIVKSSWIDDCHKQRRKLSWKLYAFENVSGSDSETEQLVASGDHTDVASGSRSRPEKKPRSRDYNSPDSETDEDSENTDDEIDRALGKKPPKVKSPDKTRTSPAKAETPEKTPTSSPKVKTPEKTRTSVAKVDTPEKNQTGSPKVKTPDKTRISPPKTLVPKKQDTVDIDALPVLPDFFKNMWFYLYGSYTQAERKQLQRYILAFDGHTEPYMGDKVTHVVAKGPWENSFDESLSSNSFIIFVKPDWILNCGRSNKSEDISKYLLSAQS